MRLTTIKLVGFKSFVDPTTLQLSSNLVGVVGPNGCGKSNIIDAIRWVMGESAASRLRGDLLTDVIFSGSSARKPVGQATVELVFDNTDGSIQGEYGRYAEISVKRQVSRDGQSAYFLNGARCRRRDVTDLFLGTGLGPRSYSIIEQGMISQIIDAHPEELRGYLEEAAGISKYKERRKETEGRIKSTRENLDRVRDVRDEVDKQLEHLQRQARAAERWTALKAEQAHREAALRALEYRTLKAAEGERRARLTATTTALERELAGQHEAEAAFEALRAQHAQANDRLNAAQAEVYRVGADIARVEQQAKHNRETVEGLERAAGSTGQEHAALAEQIRTDREQAQGLEQALGEDGPRLLALKAAEESTAGGLREAEAKLSEWQDRWDVHTRDAGESSRAVEVERTRIDYLDRQGLDLARRRDALVAEQRGIDIPALEAADAELAAGRAAQHDAVLRLGAQLEGLKEAYAGLVEAGRGLESAVGATRQELQSLHGRRASLEALQHAALGEEESGATAWLARSGLDRVRRLGAALEVDEGWEAAVETVLAGALDAVPVDVRERALTADLETLGAADLTLLDAARGTPGAQGTLAAHVSGPAVALEWLAQVQVEETLDAARARVATLEPGQSVISRGGEWLAPGWVRVRRAQGNAVGVLARERELRELATRIDELDARLAASTEELEGLARRRGEGERARDDVQRELYAAHRRQSELAGQVEAHRGKLEAARIRAGRVESALTELASGIADLEGQAREARARLGSSLGQMGDLEDRRRDLEGERRRLLEAREEARLDARAAGDQAHALELAMESRRSSRAALVQSLERMGERLEQIAVRREEIAARLAASVDPTAELDRERQTYLEQRLLVDRQLVEARQLLEDAAQALRAAEQARAEREQALTALREEQAGHRLEMQALELRAAQLAEAIHGAGLELDPLLAELADAAEPEAWRAELVELAQKIARLEPVNLAAIQEHAEQSERKVYLDRQLEDLTSALETLEDAIRKIDRETRQRFKETFDQVNAGVQALFPRLFGGGHAYLELTGDDLLSTGVSIMARPPGKRVSNITLLSGGEKALTAVTLVFSIFNLNPAPFCLLDEVDAPLDEANVTRFSHLVEEMSAKVQFIFISHNKATMEAATQLCGVTMREPGVSRLVQVDLAEAAKMTEAA